jgi:glycosyltransferase involved in cell wall biosynthesis
VLEAMACGRPVIATSVNGVPEAVVDGVSGLLIPPGDAAGLAATIERLVLDPELAREMGVRVDFAWRSNSRSEGFWRAWKHFTSKWPRPDPRGTRWPAGSSR